MGILVLADTHFGLMKGKINMSMPGYLAEFLEWVGSLEREKIAVKVIDGEIKEENIRVKIISPPEKIIFLGDMLELWDSKNETVSASILTLLSNLTKTKAEKIYVLGNHDDILRRIVLETSRAGEYLNYPLGESILKVFPDRYPPVIPGMESAAVLPSGEEKYIFVHGHQFDRDFTRSLSIYKVYPLLRTVSNSLTVYVPALFGLSFLVRAVNLIFRTSFLWGDPLVFWLLFGLSLPWIGTSIARPIWSRVVGMRYREEETVKSFIQWWKRVLSSESLPENVNVVYAHTHFLNYIPSPKHERTMDEQEVVHHGKTSSRYRKRLSDLGVKEKDMPALINISAWITDFPSFSEKLFMRSEIAYARMAETSGKAKDFLLKQAEEKKKDRLDPELVTVATFLYIDEDGFEVFGWNWYSNDPERQKVFSVPKSAIQMRREQGAITDEGARTVLKNIGWPEELLIVWTRDPHLH
ncbi:MAG: metallophosphoesterase [Theionarchaea archaeon]|nr:metallophosphoesterase [Theionarchaea archaeon]MBU7038309.1 metallophosphoesterase [Theionarchaea archaeon]